ncbi:hypothetical protein KQI52_04795 [bacterium]|nr:hypothetical protein [bacterium]
MPGYVSPLTTITWLLVTYVIQTAVDAWFTRGLLPPMAMAERVKAWAAVNAGVLVVLVLIVRLSMVPQDAFLMWTREQGVMSLGVLGVIVMYFLWSLPFVLGRGYLMLSWRGGEMSEEKRHDYWGYVWIGSVVTVFFNGFLYVAYMIVVPLMTGVDQQFGG